MGFSPLETKLTCYETSNTSRGRSSAKKAKQPGFLDTRDTLCDEGWGDHIDRTKRPAPKTGADNGDKTHEVKGRTRMEM